MKNSSSSLAKKTPQALSTAAVTDNVSEFSFDRRIDSKLLLAVIATGLMSFAGIVIETAMNVTFPTLMTEFGISISTVQWLTTAYLLMIALIIPLSAYLKARFRMKSLFIFASLLFLAGSFLGGMAPSFEIVLLGRVLQGASTGIALPLMFNIVIEQSPLKHMGIMMGIASLICAISPAVGPSFGGFIVETYGWRNIFLILIPLIIFSLLSGLTAIRQSSALQKKSFDYLSYGFLAMCFTSLIFAVSLAGELGFLAFSVRMMLIVALLGLVYFSIRTYRHDTPFIHIDVFDNPRFALSVVALMLVQFICLGLGFLLPSFAQLVRNELPFAAGAILLPGCLIGAMLAPISGRILDKFGAQRPILCGSIFLVIAGGLFYHILPEATTHTLMLIYIIFAVGQGFSSGNILTNGVKMLPANRQSDGNAIFNTLQQLAGALGTAITATIVATGQRLSPDDVVTGTLQGAQSALELLALLAILELIFMVYVLRKNV